MGHESRTDAELLRRSRRDPDAFVLVCRRHAVALELRVLDELGYEEIGQRLAITPEGARTRVFRALATLRAQIGRSA